MKTSKEKAISKTKNTAKSVNVLKKTKIIDSKVEPNVEQIREQALEIYKQRIEREEYGTAEDDWLEAEKLLKGLKDE
jgi:hypothetical protein